MFGFILVVIGVFIVWAIAKGIYDGKVFSDQKTQFVNTHQGWDTFASIYSNGVLAIKHDQSKIVLGRLDRWKEYEFSQVASVEVLRDGASIASTNRGSQAAGALIGGIALGGVGLLLGGLSGSKRNLSTLHSVAIKVIVDDREAPVYVIEFFKSPSKKGTDAQSSIIKPSLEKADHFHALLVNALRNQKSSNISHPNKASEIQKLWDLKIAGALTDDEFAKEKAKLLAGNGISTSNTPNLTK